MSSLPWRPGPVLGIETSCDETAAAVVDREHRPVVLSDVVASQVAIHAPHGGVVPELASRQHLADVRSVVERAIASVSRIERTGVDAELTMLTDRKESAAPSADALVTDRPQTRAEEISRLIAEAKQGEATAGA